MHRYVVVCINDIVVLYYQAHTNPPEEIRPAVVFLFVFFYLHGKIIFGFMFVHVL